MAEGEKTEQPTHKKLTDARKRGQVARSQDVIAGMTTAAVAVAVVMSWQNTQRAINELIQDSFHLVGTSQEVPMAQVVNESIMVLIQATIPIAIAVIIGVVASNVLQFGFVLAFESLKPDVSKLNPFSALKKMFSMKSLVEFSKSLIKITVIFMVAWHMVKDAAGALAYLPFGGLGGIFEAVPTLLYHLFGAIILTYGALAGGDYLLQRFIWLKELRMTKEEVKREYKESEGDPHIKGHRKSLARALVFEDNSEATKQSSVLITNPTHFAAGLYFEQGKIPLPVLRAKGSGMKALQMKKVAQDNDIPIVENIPLARALCEQMEVNDFVPSDLIAPVAEVLRFVQKQKRQRG